MNIPLIPPNQAAKKRIMLGLSFKHNAGVKKEIMRKKTVSGSVIILTAVDPTKVLAQAH